ncbi:Fe-S oxidoreductase [Candidatus Methanoperedens nitroreducens]|uniref:Fe-S oxidoreductase n=1 Tax=Candidatus Methanoperedens nitratireducens TaxID=1392998 RepID=A0A062V0K3_9EURY|nr:PqqD family peptide modification chaperone [Candidatus Methanoperedens nitroreducens]KCZ72676.1 Fe-S oxidoreductase [Candidatus Methanoperedens nitroreducens]MDJ1423392.1 radical SAM protein [Candidatus Methanoperedens sp.]
MLTKLLFPPQWIPTQPYLSLPSLFAFLKANYCDVEQMDINVSFYDDLLSKQGLSAFYEKVYSKFQDLESQKELSPHLQKQYTALSSSVLFGEYIIDETDNAKKILRDKKGFYNVKELFRAFKILELGLKLVSSAYYPTNLTFHSYDMRYSCRSSKAILASINDREENLFIDYFEKETVPKILENRPDLIGISIINTSQLIPGLTLASLIKRADENIHINIGGSVFTRLINEISKNNELFSIFDSVIVHEGETALLNLTKHLSNGLDIEDIPNLIYKKGSGIRINKLSSEGEDINSLPSPCFDGLPFSLYFSPELILPVLSSRGCYWKRCTFCDHSYGYSGNYRPRNVDLLYNDIKTLKDRYKTSFFTFQDEGVSPRLISALSDKIIENNLDISWLADSRFDPVFSEEFGNRIADAGCKMLYFGLESANNRILSCMDKGIKKDNVLNICRYCADAGIWTHLFLIFGFPTETRHEARETVDFILHNNKIIRSMSFGSFQLTKHSKVYENPPLFDVKTIIRNENIDLSLWYDYETTRGMSKKETDELIQEFYNELSLQYRDFSIWSNLDREHLFLYISHYKGSKDERGLSELIDRIQKEQIKKYTTTDTRNNGIYPVLNEGVFIRTFNFNLAQIIHTMLAGDSLENRLQKDRTNVLFDTNNNRVFTITDFAKDVLDRSSGELDISEIIEVIREKYQMPYTEAESKCKSFLKGLFEKNIVYY